MGEITEAILGSILMIVVVFWLVGIVMSLWAFMLGRAEKLTLLFCIPVVSAVLLIWIMMDDDLPSRRSRRRFRRHHQ